MLLPLLLAWGGCAEPEVASVSTVPGASQSRAKALVAAVLEGDRSRFDAAVDELWTLHRANPQRVDRTRALARLLNLPLAEGDLRYSGLQRDLYASVLDHGSRDSNQRFIDETFYTAASAASRYRRGHPVQALRTLRALERRVETRLAQTQHADLHAMLGNYAHQASGLVSLGRRRRSALATEHLEHTVHRFDELSPSAQGRSSGVPGVRVVFSFWLAELTQARGDTDLARERYLAVADALVQSEPTPASRVVAAVAAARVHDPPPPGEELLPLWPSGYDSCIACHARSATPRPPPAN